MSRARAHSDRGVTLIEILVVLAILALLMLSAIGGLRHVRKTDLKEDASRLAAAFRFAYDRATATGEHHRVVIDLDHETFQVERCEGKVKLQHGLEAQQMADMAAIQAQSKLLAPAYTGQPLAVGPQASGGLMAGTPLMAPPTVSNGFGGQMVAGAVGAGGAGAPGQQTQQLPANAGKAIGGARCVPVKGANGKVQVVKKNRGIGISRVYVAHLPYANDTGRVTVNFFPLGTAERAVVEVADKNDNAFSIVVHPLTGRVTMIGGVYQHPEDFITRDSEGSAIQ